MLKTREHVIYHKLPYFPLNLGKNLGKTWESIFSQVLFETSLLSSKEKVNFTCFFDFGKDRVVPNLEKMYSQESPENVYFRMYSGT